VRKQKTLLMEVDPLTDEFIRHYFKLHLRQDGWRLRCAVQAVRGTRDLTPTQRIGMVKDLVK
jgi:site-specific recombinase XerD